MIENQNGQKSGNQLDSIARIPRGIVKLNNQDVKFEEVDIRSGAPYTCDTYEVVMPLYGQPEGIDLAFFASADSFTIGICIGFPSDQDAATTNELVLLIAGENNDVEIDPTAGIVRISGRDLSSRLIDKKVTQAFNNITASGLARLFASENGLKADVVDTTEIIGNFLQVAQTYTASNYTQWDMLVEAAIGEDFLVYVRGDTLVFKPIPSGDDVRDTYVLNYTPRSIDSAFPTFDQGTRMSFFRNNIVSGNISVTVKVPYSSYSGKAFHVKQQSKSSSASNDAFIRKYVFSHPGLTNEQAVEKAKQLLKNLSIHAVRLSADLVFDTKLQKEMLIKVTGTNTELDQLYYIDSLVRRMTMDDFSMFVSAKNKSIGTDLES